MPRKSKLKFSEKSIDEPEIIETLAPEIIVSPPAVLPADTSSSKVKKPRKPKILVSSDVISDKPKKASAPRPRKELKGIFTAPPKNKLKDIPAATPPKNELEEIPEKVVVQMPVVPEVNIKQQNQLRQLEIKRELEELRNKQAHMKMEQLKEKERAKIELLQMKHQHESQKIQQKKREIEVASVVSQRPQKITTTTKQAPPSSDEDTDDEDDEIAQESRLEARKPTKKVVPVKTTPANPASIPVNPVIHAANLPQRRLHPSQYLAQFGF